MAIFAMTRETDGPKLGPLPARAALPNDVRPLDFLVNALNRAVVRKQAAKTEETDCPT